MNGDGARRPTSFRSRWRDGRRSRDGCRGTGAERRPGTGQDLIGRNAGVEFAAAAGFLGVEPRRVAHLVRDLALQSGVVERIARVGVGAAASDAYNGDTAPWKAGVLTARANVADGMNLVFLLVGEGEAGCEEKKEKESSD